MMTRMTSPLASAPNRRPIESAPGFALLFTVSLRAKPDLAALERSARAGGLTVHTAAQLAAYQALREATEVHVLGRAFLAAGRLEHRAVGRIDLAGRADEAGLPSVADVHLFTHVAGVALWEVWLRAPRQSFDAERWIGWLDEAAAGALPQHVWQAIRPLNDALGGRPEYHQFLPCTVVRLPTQPLAALTAHHAADLVRLLWRDRSARALKPEVVAAELSRDYCAREGGITLLGRRAGLDVHGSEDEAAAQLPLSPEDCLPPKSASPFLVTIELLLIERAVLLQLYERLSQRTPASIDALLALKQEVTDGLEEYYGATMAATRFGDEVAADGERLLGIVDLYDALMDRLEMVSFALTTRYQQRMTAMQFWLTVVFGASEIGFIAASIATWHYRTELGAVLAWTLGATVVTAAALVALLRQRMERP